MDAFQQIQRQLVPGWNEQQLSHAVFVYVDMTGDDDCCSKISLF